MNKQYHLLIRYFLLMSLMLLGTGVWLLFLHASFSLEEFTSYYVQKSLLGLLEIVSPHLFAMGTVVFVLTHFLALNRKNTRFDNRITLTLFTLMLLSNLSGFFITKNIPWVIWIKTITLILFLLFFLMLTGRIFYRTSHKT